MRFKLITQVPTPESHGEGILNVSTSGSATFWGGLNDSQLLSEMQHIRILHASSYGMMFSGMRYMSTDRHGRLVYTYQEWYLKNVGDE